MRALLPSAVAVRATTRVYEQALPLPPDEQDAVARAIPRRQAEFAAGRTLARLALADLGVEAGAIGMGPRREPVWPDGVVGSITHCAGFAAAAVASTSDIASLGIDAEPAGRRLSEGVIVRVCHDSERRQVEALGEVGPLVVFSAKEAVYKAWYPVAARWLGFEHVDVDVDVDGGAFAVRPRVDDPVGLAHGVGRWAVRDGFVMTALVIPAS